LAPKWAHLSDHLPLFSGTAKSFVTSESPRPPLCFNREGNSNAISNRTNRVNAEAESWMIQFVPQNKAMFIDLDSSINKLLLIEMK
jgi:hypothetical protein